MATYILKSKSV